MHTCLRTVVLGVVVGPVCNRVAKWQALPGAQQLTAHTAHSVNTLVPAARMRAVLGRMAAAPAANEANAQWLSHRTRPNGRRSEAEGVPKGSC